MNFWLMIVFVISTTGICNVNAAWDENHSLIMVDYYDKFIQAMAMYTDQETAKQTESYKDDVLTEMERSNWNYEAFKEHTGTILQSILFQNMNVAENEKASLKLELLRLCTNINEESNGISIPYKFDNIPHRDVLKNFFTNKLGNSPNDFDQKYCHSAMRPSTGQSYKDIMGDYFFTFISDVEFHLQNGRQSYANYFKTDYGNFLRNTNEMFQKFLINAVPMDNDNRAFLKLAILRLCGGINEEGNGIPPGLKFQNIPHRDVLKNFFTNKLGNTVADFNKKYCHSATYLEMRQSIGQTSGSRPGN